MMGATHKDGPVPDSRMNDSTIRPESTKHSIILDANEAEQRKAFLELGAEDSRLLVELHTRLADQTSFFVHDFYAHLLAFEETRRLIPDEATLAKLSKTQAAYFSRLTAGEYDAEYIQDRLRIGTAHQRVELEPKWYIGAYNKYLALLLPKVWQFYQGDETKLLATTRALLKVIFLDMGIAIDTYIYANQQAIRDKAAQLDALNQIAVAISSSLGLENLLNKIMASGISLIGAKAASVAFFNEDTQKFDEWHTQGLSNSFIKNMHFRRNGLAEETFRGNGHIISNNRRESKHKLSKLARSEGVQSFICLPLSSHARRQGVLYFYREDRDDFLPEEISLLTTLSYLAAGALENARLHAKTVTLAATDALTGLSNRRTFDERFKAEFQRAQRFDKPFALLLLDIDHFKHINDTYGHVAGDEVLKSLAKILKKQTRDVDIVARYGGEEFTVILPESDGDKAQTIAERIRRTVSNTSFLMPGEEPITITVSIGVACYPCCAPDATQMVERADQAMYLAKQTGRNRVSLYHGILDAGVSESGSKIVELLRQGTHNASLAAAMVDAKVPFFRDHVKKVEEYSIQFGKKLKLSKKDQETLKLAAILQDLGYLTISETMLSKRETFAPDEWAQIKQHPVTGANLIEQVPALAPVLPAVRHHHEWYDGNGYPDGLKGDAIPYLARVLAIADSYASLVSDRPYRRAFKPYEARALITAGSGKQFDPELAAQFVAMLEQADSAQH